MEVRHVASDREGGSSTRSLKGLNEPKGVCEFTADRGNFAGSAGTSVD
jgi:hypothetical protein